MIEPTKRRLTLLFTSIILAINVLSMTTLSFYLYRNLVEIFESSLRYEVLEDLVEPFSKGNIADITKELEPELFQVVRADGTVAYASQNPLEDVPPMEPEYVAAALAGKSQFSRQTVGGNSYLVLYHPLDKELVARGVASVHVLVDFEKKLIVIGLVGLLLICGFSYFISRYLVQRAMMPISEVFQFQESFSSNVTHELMSPLTSLKGNLEVAQRRNRSHEEYLSVIQLGLREVDRIIDLLNTLYLLATSKFKKLELYQEDLNIEDLLEEVVAQYRHPIKEKDINLKLRNAPGTVLRGDVNLIRRILENLIDNATKYTPELGSIAVAIEIHSESVRVVVENTFPDTGVENTNQWFEPFLRGRQSEMARIPGKGLGLYISRYIARSHGGDLILENLSEGILAVTLTLPASGRPHSSSASGWRPFRA